MATLQSSSQRNPQRDGGPLKLEEFAGQLEENEKSEYESLVAEAKSEGIDPKQLRGRLARLATSVLKRLGEQPNPGSIIGEFSKTYLAVTQKHEALPLEELSRRFPTTGIHPQKLP